MIIPRLDGREHSEIQIRILICHAGWGHRLSPDVASVTLCHQQTLMIKYESPVSNLVYQSFSPHPRFEDGKVFTTEP